MHCIQSTEIWNFDFFPMKNVDNMQILIQFRITNVLNSMLYHTCFDGAVNILQSVSIIS